MRWRNGDFGVFFDAAGEVLDLDRQLVGPRRTDVDLALIRARAAHPRWAREAARRARDRHTKGGPGRRLTPG